MKAIAVVGLGFGDEGKGSVVDYLCRTFGADLVVRFNGGPQAAHNVVIPGHHHTFSTWGSGTLYGVKTLLLPEVLVDPLAAFNEARALEEIGLDPWDLLYLTERSSIITPWHVALNRVKSWGRKNAGRPHGTCGRGIGETQKDRVAGRALTVGDLLHSTTSDLKVALMRIRQRIMNEAIEAGFASDEARRELWREVDWPIVELLERYRDFVSRANVLDRDFFRGANRVVFEGAQGVLLDQMYGFHPHTTWSDCTFGNIKQYFHMFERVLRLGVCRTYMTRHGQGPFPSEVVPDRDMARTYEEPHNGGGGWQGIFRIGYPDFDLLRFSAHVIGGIDGLVLTHLDRPWMFGHPTIDDRVVRTKGVRRVFEDQMGVDVLVSSHGPSSVDKTHLLSSWRQTDERTVRTDGQTTSRDEGSSVH